MREVALPLLDGGGGVPVEADGYFLGHAHRPYAGLSIAVSGVEGKAHDLKLLSAVARTAQSIELVYFVQLCVEEVAVRLGGAHHESGVGHVGVNLLDDQPFGTRTLILVGTFRVHLVLPLALALQVVFVAAAHVGHDAVDGFGDAILARAGACHEHVHQGGFVLHIVDVAEAYPPQMGGKRGKDGVRHGRTVEVGGAAQEEFDEGGQALGENRREGSCPTHGL